MRHHRRRRHPQMWDAAAKINVVNKRKATQREIQLKRRVPQAAAAATTAAAVAATAATAAAQPLCEMQRMKRAPKPETTLMLRRNVLLVADQNSQVIHRSGTLNSKRFEYSFQTIFFYFAVYSSHGWCYVWCYTHQFTKCFSLCVPRASKNKLNLFTFLRQNGNKI